MQKLYTPFSHHESQKPSEKALRFILDFAASHRGFSIDKGRSGVNLN